VVTNEGISETKAGPEKSAKPNDPVVMEVTGAAASSSAENLTGKASVKIRKWSDTPTNEIEKIAAANAVKLAETEEVADKKMEFSRTPAIEAGTHEGTIMEPTVQAETLAMVHQLLPAEAEPNDLTVTLREPGDDYFVISHRKRNYLAIKGGAAYMPGWDTRAGIDAKGLNWVASAEYGLYVSSKLSLASGVQAYNITNIRTAFYTAQSTSYAFSAMNSGTVLTASSLYYMAVPLLLNYHLSEGRRLGIGISAGYLLGSNNRIDYTVKDEFGTKPPPSERIRGYYNAFRRYNTLLTGSYTTVIYNRLSVEGEIFYGLTDLIINNDQKKDAEVPMGVRLSLRYSIFDK
jgi:hypothetical protein